MDSEQFAQTFSEHFRELYRLAVRRVGSGHDVLSVETTALLLHLSQAGPVTLSELTRHLGRALSTLSAKVAELEAQGLVARQSDPSDARRSLLWLSARGRATLVEALNVLDTQSLAEAASSIPVSQRAQLLDGMRALIQALPKNLTNPGGSNDPSL
jgi:DNA-binding MarR family transcriptional regulator